MKVLSISTDRKVFEPESAVRARLLDYGQLVDEIHVIVFAKRSLGLRDEKIASNVFIYPTNSLSRFTHILAAISRARKLMRAGQKIDLVTTQDPFETGMAGSRTAQLFEAKLHVQIHTDFMSKYFASESLLNRWRVSVAKFVIPQASAIRVVSGRIKKSVEKLVQENTKVAVLPIFVEQKKEEEVFAAHDLRKKYPQFDFRILVVARLAREKNIQSVLEATAMLAKENPKVGLIIVGDGPERKSLEGLVAELGISKNVMFEGWQEHLFTYYKTADVFVLPSLYEGYGMAAVEALLAGCPVVMTDVGCARDVVIDGKNGLIVPVDDSKALFLAVRQIMLGEVKFDLTMPKLPTKEDYLAAYKKSWQEALL